MIIRKRDVLGTRLGSRRLLLMIVSIGLMLFISACDKKESQKEIMVGAAASLQPVMEELKEIYEDQNQNIKVSFTFAGSGTLEQQIREGAPMDLFLCAAAKQMDSLEKEDYLLSDTRIDLLENEIALIVPKGSTLKLADFQDILSAPVIALGNPESVPVGQYAQEIFTNLGIWKEVSAKATLGKDVTEVLSWVSAGNADAGVVYTTDALTNNKVEIVAIAAEDSHSRVIYPAAVLKGTKNKKETEQFLHFLTTEEAMKVFTKYGFKPIEAKEELE